MKEKNSNDTEKELLSVTKILYNLRYYTKEWERLYGVETKRVKKYWEAKADEWCNIAKNAL